MPPASIAAQKAVRTRSFRTWSCVGECQEPHGWHRLAVRRGRDAVAARAFVQAINQSCIEAPHVVGHRFAIEDRELARAAAMLAVSP